MAARTTPAPFRGNRAVDVFTLALGTALGNTGDIVFSRDALAVRMVSVKHPAARPGTGVPAAGVTANMVAEWQREAQAPGGQSCSAS